MAIKNLLKNVVGAVAPTLGTALGGPMGGMAANMIADVLGCPNNPKSIEQAVQNATPEQLDEIKKAVEDLTKASQSFAEKLYAEAQQENQASENEDGPDDVVEGEVVEDE